MLLTPGTLLSNLPVTAALAGCSLQPFLSVVRAATAASQPRPPVAAADAARQPASARRGGALKRCPVGSPADSATWAAWPCLAARGDWPAAAAGGAGEPPGERRQRQARCSSLCGSLHCFRPAAGQGVGQVIKRALHGSQGRNRADDLCEQGAC